MLRIVDKPTWLHEDDIEAKADDLLRSYELQTGWNPKPPVPTERIIEEYLDLNILWCKIPDDQDRPILACIDPQSKQIRMNESYRGYFDEYSGTETFTYAHEIGHWVLHVQKSGAVQLCLLDSAVRPFVCRKVDDTPSSFEWQANRFAASLIMPKKMLQDYAAGRDLCSWESINDLKGILGVSKKALLRRLSDTGMLYVSPEKELYPSYAAYCGQPGLL
jgi:hypothetical protein